MNFRGRVFIAFLLTAALAGVVGNRTDVFVVEILPEFLSQKLTISVGWLAFALIWLVGFPLYRSRKYQVALQNVSNLNKIGDKLARSIPSLYALPADREIAELSAQRFARSLFKDIVKDSPFDTCGIAIYYPNRENTDYLNTWLSYSSPNETSSTLAFYIGSESGPDSPSNARGIAGTTFLDGQTRIVHFDKDERPDNRLYLASDNGRIGYRSLICSVISSGLEPKSIGVLCLYGSSQSAFDSKSTSTIVESLAYRFSAVLTSFSE